MPAAVYDTHTEPSEMVARAMERSITLPAIMASRYVRTHQKKRQDRLARCDLLKLEVLDVYVRRKMRTFMDTLCGPLGSRPSAQFTAEQLASLPRLRKMLGRMSDLNNFAGERRNATMALHTSLDKLQLVGRLKKTFRTTRPLCRIHFFICLLRLLNVVVVDVAVVVVVVVAV